MLRNSGRNGCSVVHRECLLLASTLTVHACTDKNVPCGHWLRISSCQFSTKALPGSCAAVSVVAEKSRSRESVVIDPVSPRRQQGARQVFLAGVKRLAGRFVGKNSRNVSRLLFCFFSASSVRLFSEFEGFARPSSCCRVRPRCAVVHGGSRSAQAPPSSRWPPTRCRGEANFAATMDVPLCGIRLFPGRSFPVGS